MIKNNIKQTRNTTSFLKSYSIQKQMRTVSGFDEDHDMTTVHPVQLHPQNPYDTNLQCGQIRLLSQLNQITYVVLLCRREEDSFDVMTFSHYDFPATDKEFKPEFDGGMYLNVLQAWNTRTLQDETLKKSWLIGELPASDCSDALELRNHSLNGCPISTELIEKTGLPITDKDDPRNQYIREERAVFNQLDNAERRKQDKPETVHEPSGFIDWLKRIALPPLWNEEEYALAAGDEKKDIVVECTPYGHDEFVTIVFSGMEKVLRVNIYTSDQSEISHAFDAWELVSEDYSVLGVIQNGCCVVHTLESFDGKCALRNPADQTIVLFEKSQE